MCTMSNKGRTLKEKKMLNRVAVLGRLVKDPELRKAANGETSFATFSLAVDNTAKNADGTRGTLFIDCRVFGSQAENLVKHTHKGSKVVVDGSINQRDFIRQDGTKGKAIEIYVDSVTFLDPKPTQEEEDSDGPYDSAGSLDGEKYVDKDGKEQTLKAVPPQPKFDPMTGKPLTPKAKK